MAADCGALQGNNETGLQGLGKMEQLKQACRDLKAGKNTDDTEVLAREIIRLSHCSARYLYSDRNSHDVEDIAQEAIYRITKNILKFEGNSQFSTWVGGCVRITGFKKYRDFVRHDSRKDELSRHFLSLKQNESASFVERMTMEESHELYQDVRAVIATLPPCRRLAMEMRHDKGMGFREIAESLGRKKDTITSNYSEALRYIREKFGSEYSGSRNHGRK